MNDILSLKKEIKHGDIDSIVPLLMYHRGLTVQEAIAVRDDLFDISCLVIIVVPVLFEF